MKILEEIVLDESADIEKVDRNFKKIDEILQDAPIIKDADEEIDISSFKGILIAKDTGAVPETIPLGYSYETYETS